MFFEIKISSYDYYRSDNNNKIYNNFSVFFLLLEFVIV